MFTCQRTARVFFVFPSTVTFATVEGGRILSSFQLPSSVFFYFFLAACRPLLTTNPYLPNRFPGRTWPTSCIAGVDRTVGSRGRILPKCSKEASVCAKNLVARRRLTQNLIDPKLTPSTPTTCPSAVSPTSKNYASLPMNTAETSFSKIPAALFYPPTPSTIARIAYRRA